MFEWLKDKFGKGAKEEQPAKQEQPTEKVEEALDKTPDQLKDLAEEPVTSKETKENTKETHADENADVLESEASEKSSTDDEVNELEAEIEESNADQEDEQEAPVTSEEIHEEAEEAVEEVAQESGALETEIVEDEVQEDLEIHEQVLETELDKVDAEARVLEEQEIETEDEEKEATEFAATETMEPSDEVVEDEIKEEAVNETPQEAKPEKSFFQRLKDGLTKTRDEMSYKINDVLGNYVKIDEDMLEELEYILISADVGMETTMKLIDRLRDRIREDQVKDPKAVIPLLAEEMEALLDESNLSTKLNIEPSPAVILVVGVNGVGKTTTIGKLAHQLKSEGKEVILAAADTFRAAAIEQLQTWGQRTNTPVIAHKEGADPAAVVFDAIQATKARGADVLICDTAGRLHNKSNLMKELEKIHRVVEKEFPEAKRESLLVLDATTGQNALIQAKTFKEVTELTGIVLTKLDGTAKGGVILPLQTELKIPIKYVGVGESIDDLQPFYSKDFTKALLGLDK